MREHSGDQRCPAVSPRPGGSRARTPAPHRRPNDSGGGQGPAARAVETSRTRRKRLRVLVVDDDEAVRESLKKVIRTAGFEVVAAADGREAMQQLHSGPVSLLVLDLGLPFESGWEVFERVTNEDPALPIIILTGQANQIRMALAAGVGALVEKPMDPVQLLHTMKALLAEPQKVRLRRASGRTQKIRYLPSRSAQFLNRIRPQSETPVRLSDPDDARAW